MEISRSLLGFTTYLHCSWRALCSSVQPARQHHKVLIIGGGTGGASVASRLNKLLDSPAIAVVEPSEIHYYQPLWTLVGAGIKPMAQSFKPTPSVLPSSVSWIQDKVTRFEPESSTVHLETGTKLTYDHLVLALGIEPRYDLITGATAALQSDHRVVSNYSPLYVEKTFKAFVSFKGGPAIFTLPVGPIKCAGAPQKVMYLFEDHLKQSNRRETADIHYFTALPKMFSVDKYAKALAGICDARGIHCHLQHHLVEVNSAKSEVTVEDLSTKEHKTLNYQFLHITPPMTVPEVLRSTPNLTNPDFVTVDSETLRHVHYPNIWALGDCSSLPTSKTAAAVASQSAVLSNNLYNAITGDNSKMAVYDGYTACPLLTSYNRAIFAEFDYTLTPLETFPFDQSQESLALYYIKTELLPLLYWDWLIKGIWSGPKLFRKLFHFDFIKSPW